MCIALVVYVYSCMRIHMGVCMLHTSSTLPREYQMRKYVGIVLSIATLILVVHMGWGYMVAQDKAVLRYMEGSPSTTVPTTSPCEEDEPCWDCTSMGNRICGNTVSHIAQYEDGSYAVYMHDGSMHMYCDPRALCSEQ